jgi:hypothetical protein
VEAPAPSAAGRRTKNAVAANAIPGQRTNAVVTKLFMILCRSNAVKRVRINGYAEDTTPAATADAARKEWAAVMDNAMTR